MSMNGNGNGNGLHGNHTVGRLMKLLEEHRTKVAQLEAVLEMLHVSAVEKKQKKGPLALLESALAIDEERRSKSRKPNDAEAVSARRARTVDVLAKFSEIPKPLTEIDLEPSQRRGLGSLKHNGYLRRTAAGSWARTRKEFHP